MVHSYNTWEKKQELVAQMNQDLQMTVTEGNILSSINSLKVSRKLLLKISKMIIKNLDKNVRDWIDVVWVWPKCFGTV